MTLTDFVDESGNTRLRGQLVPAPGGSQTVQLLGPFNVTWETPNINNPEDGIGALVGPVLDIGTLVLFAWCATSVPWVAETSVSQLYLQLATSSDALYDPTTFSALDAVLVAVGQGSPVTPQPVFLRNTTDQLGFQVVSTGALTAGEGDIYALVAVPLVEQP